MHNKLMRYFKTNHGFYVQNAMILLLVAVLFNAFLGLKADARSLVTPWSSNISFQNLVYGASTPYEVEEAVGKPPDNVIKDQQMYPVVENYYYFDNTGAASVFIFENNLLVGLFYKSPHNQYIDLTYFLTNDGDRGWNSPIMGNMSGFYPQLPMYVFGF